MLFTRKLTLVVAARSEAGFEDALAEATRLINQGCVSGKNSNDEGSFYFTGDNEVDHGDLPSDL